MSPPGDVSSEVLVERLSSMRDRIDDLASSMRNSQAELVRGQTATNEKLDKLDMDMRIGYVTRLDMAAEVGSLEKRLDGFVTKDQFWPIRAIVYGFIGLVLLSFGGLLIFSVGWSGK